VKIASVVGARPNFMKIAPIVRAIRERAERQRLEGGPHVSHLLVHTGQHYDREMSELFFEQLDLPAPDVNLGVGSASQAAQTAEVMTRFEKVCLGERPTHVLVVGDVNSTIACALVAVKLGITVAHVEAGLRSFDRRMPEEINRILTDAISDYLFTTEASANANLKREGITEDKIHFVGNVMIDTLLLHRKRAERSPILQKLGLAEGDIACTPYGVLTLHRAGTVDAEESLREILEAVADIAGELPIVFPAHPRTLARINSFGMRSFLGEGYESRRGGARRGILAIEPLGYLDFLRLMSKAKVVLTDSGGIQEETTILGVPCVTLRESTERPVTVLEGTNVIAGIRRDGIVSHARAQLARSSTQLAVGTGAGIRRVPELWDGKAAQRIVEVLLGGEEYRP
jgi:UDP-N-acetylglucosamine 2-epimerase (non-hydrolysing)